MKMKRCNLSVTSIVGLRVIQHSIVATAFAPSIHVNMMMYKFINGHSYVIVSKQLEFTLIISLILQF